MVGSLGNVLILLKNRANPFLTTVFGSTPLDLLAKANGNLLAKGNHCGDQIRHAIFVSSVFIISNIVLSFDLYHV